MKMFFKNEATGRIEEMKEENLIQDIIQAQIELEDKHGKLYELHKTVEELTELSLELQQHLNKQVDNRDKILEEYIDVIMKLYWLTSAFMFDDVEIKKMIRKKLSKIYKDLKEK